MIALVLALFVPVVVQKPAPAKPVKPAKPAATKPAKEPTKLAAEPVRVTLEQLAPERSAIVFAAPSLVALERAIAPARAWLGGPHQFVEKLTGLALPAGALDAAKPLLVAGSVEGEASWAWTIAGSAVANGAAIELAPPWRRVDVAGHAVWTQRVEFAPAKAASTATVDPAIDLSIRIDVRAAIPVLDAASNSIDAILAELMPPEGLFGPYGAAPRLVFSAFVRALENSEQGTLEVRGKELRWTGVPMAGAPFEGLGQGEPRGLTALACWIDSEADSWFVGRASPEAPFSGQKLLMSHWSGLVGGRGRLPEFEERGSHAPAIAIARSVRKGSVVERMVLDATDPTATLAHVDKVLFSGLEGVEGVRIETVPHPWGEVRSAWVPIDSRTIELLDPSNPGKSADLLLARVGALKRLHGADEVRRVRALRDGRVAVLLGVVEERDAVRLVEPLLQVPRPDVAVAIAGLTAFPSGFASSMDLGAEVASLRASIEAVASGDPSGMRRDSEFLAGPTPGPGEFVVTHLWGFGPDSLFLRVKTNFALLLGPLSSAREKRIRKEEAGRLRETAEHKKIADDFYMLHGAVSTYRDNNKRWPESLAALGLPDPQGLTYLVGDVLPNDPWGRPYVCIVEAKQVVVATLGADGAKGGSGLDTDVEKSMR